VSRREELAAALAALEQRLAAACSAAGRPREEVRLVAVTKTWPASDVALLHALGVTDVGENKDQEAAAKVAELAGTPLRWHFVGQVQRNKARSIASYADVVHSLDRPALVPALSAGAVRAERRLDVLVQVALEDAAPDPAATGRGGVRPDAVAGLADLVAQAEGLRLAGVMAVAPRGGDAGAAFARLADCAAALRRDHPGAVEISAGMSGDLEQAVANGATLVRVGTALLGSRPPLLR
jgi:pyridoxal phosphate enzyme (YggS family)